MLVKDFLAVSNDSSDIQTEEGTYEYTFHGLLCNRWELRKYIGSIRTTKISEEEKNNVLNKEIASISSTNRASWFYVYIK